MLKCLNRCTRAYIFGCCVMEDWSREHCALRWWISSLCCSRLEQAMVTTSLVYVLITARMFAPSQPLLCLCLEKYYWTEIVLRGSTRTTPCLTRLSSTAKYALLTTSTTLTALILLRANTNLLQSPQQSAIQDHSRCFMDSAVWGLWNSEFCID